jgi:hypothetical protein
MLALLGEMTAAEVGLKPRASTGPRGAAATTSGRVANLIVGNGHRRPGNCLNLSNRPVRTRMPGGVAGDAEASPPRPYADCAEYERQLGGGSPLSSLMTAKG